MITTKTAFAVCSSAEVRKACIRKLDQITEERNKAKELWFNARRHSTRSWLKGNSEKDIEKAWNAVHKGAATSQRQLNAAIKADLERACRNMIALCDLSSEVSVSYETIEMLGLNHT